MLKNSLESIGGAAPERSSLQLEVREKEEGLIALEELNNLAEANKINGNSKKILFIDFKTSVKVTENENYSFQNFMNLGVHRMAGYLRDYGVDATIVYYDELTPELLAEHDIVGVSHLTGQVEEAYSVCREIKEKFGDEKLIVGGGEHYLGYKRILADKENNGIDACCLGQGELAMLALALGVPIEQVGSLVYRPNESDKQYIVKNKLFERLADGVDYKKSNFGILNARPALPFSKEEISERPPFNELNDLPDFKFDGTFVTQAGSGCVYGCTFCPSRNFFGPGQKSNEVIAKTEIENFKKEFPHLKNVFMTFADAMLNPSEEYLESIVSFMSEINKKGDHKISWFSYLSAPVLKRGESPESWTDKWDGVLAKMAEAGCIMGAVGVEEVIFDRNKSYEKGKGMAPEFIDLVGSHMLTRSLLILGQPEHFYVNRDELGEEKGLRNKYKDKSDRELIRGEILEFMKEHPQALYRMNPWTLVYGTDNFYKYEDCLAEDVSDLKKLKLLDTMHSLIDPKKMYARLERDLNIIIPEEKRWVKSPDAWPELMDEIMEEYLTSSEHEKYLRTLEDRVVNGKRGLLFDIAMKFKENALVQVRNNREKRKK